MPFAQAETSAAQRRILFRLVTDGGAAAVGFVPERVIVSLGGSVLIGSGAWHETDPTHAPGWYYYELRPGELWGTGELGLELVGDGIALAYAVAGDSVTAAAQAPLVDVVVTPLSVAASQRRQPRSRRGGRRR